MSESKRARSRAATSDSHVFVRRRSKSCDALESLAMDIHQTNPFEYYHDGSNKLSDDSRPIGFLSFIDQHESTSKQITKEDMILRYKLLRKLFPTFPTEMLKTLLLREDGNTEAITKELLSKGWKANNTVLLKSVQSDTIGLSLPYYWGELKPIYLDTLERQQCGSYFTVWKNNHFLLCALSHKKRILQTQSDSPNVSESQKLLFSLTKPLHRPSSVPLNNLIPFFNE